MSEQIVLNAEVRNDQGKGASRRLRRIEKKVPAIIYGDNKEPEAIQCQHKELHKLQENEAFFSSVITINVGGQEQHAIIKDMQRHPAKDLIVHADFLRVDPNKKIIVNVPLHFINELACHGVKMQGGLISHAATDIEVSCLPGNLPEYIEVDMLNVKLGDIVHLSDITLPEGVESIALSHGEDHDLPIVQILAPKGGPSADEDEDAAAAAAASAESEADKE